MPKYECCFCGKTNTKWQDVTESSGFLGLSNIKIGEKEIVDEDLIFYRCVSCGRQFCESHFETLCKKERKEKTWITNKTIKYNECPKCYANQIEKL